MSENLKNLEAMVGAGLAERGEPLTTDTIRDLVEKVRQICPVSDKEAEQLVRKLEARHVVSMDVGSILVDSEFEPWLENERPQMEFFYWERYKDMLRQDKNLSLQVLATLDKVTDSILGHLGNPSKKDGWKRRGMVVGYVQSGKTANYIGLICKAADAGYRVIILIAGIHNNLRSQTQIRVDEGFVGFDSTKLQTSSPEKIVGVGRFGCERRPITFTNSYHDFNKNMATSVGVDMEKHLKEPAIFVIKKNTNTLKNLTDWLKSNAKTGKISSPMLLIDDEADNASINIKAGKDEVSRINGQIRDLLDMFSNRCYVGYTATPFANIFIDPDSEDDIFREDLFPRDFIVSLDPPDNYFGPEQLFLDDATRDRVIHNIEDNEDIISPKQATSPEIREIPESLRQAIRTFILVIAIRRARDHEREHNSMLVNVSRFVEAQRQIGNEIREFVKVIRQSLRVNGAKPEAEAVLDPEIDALRIVFIGEFGSRCEFSWSDIQPQLHKIAAAVKVVEVNSTSRDSLNYFEYKDSGLNVIAIGGFSLSRGLTLEGLHVSYFLRNSMMYDTLMQMGRWFGYREGYEDLCRIWMPEESEGWYTHITESIGELRDDLRRMEQLGATPREFGLKVRSHPTSLIVTARNKMGSAKSHTVAVGLANRFIETSTLSWDHDSVEKNRQAAIKLANALRGMQKAPEGGKIIDGGRLVQSAPVSVVVDFLDHFQNHPESTKTETDLVRNYIQNQPGTILESWDILFAGVGDKSEFSLVDNSLGFRLVCQQRTHGTNSVENKTLLIGNKQRVASRGVERYGLEEAQIAEVRAKERTRQEQKNKLTSAGSTNYPDRIYRKVRSKPLLIVHLLAIGKKKEDGEKKADFSKDAPVVAWSMSFPQSEGEEKRVEYLVNTTWFREQYKFEKEKEAEGDED